MREGRGRDYRKREGVREGGKGEGGREGGGREGVREGEGGGSTQYSGNILTIVFILSTDNTFQTTHSHTFLYLINVKCIFRLDWQFLWVMRDVHGANMASASGSSS